MSSCAIVVASNRMALRSRLPCLLGREADVRYTSRYSLVEILTQSAGVQGEGTARVFIVDVVSLFAPRPVGPLPPLAARPANVLVVGSRDDTDALLEAVTEGIPVFVVEHLRAGALLEMIEEPEGAGRHRGLYCAIGQLSAQRAYGLLARKWAAPALTGRESAILALVRQGHSNSAIARSLSIQEKTVKNHLTRVYDKLGVAGRSQAIARGPSRSPILLSA